LAIPLFFHSSVEAAEPTEQNAGETSLTNADARQASTNCWAVIVGVADYRNYYSWNGDLWYPDDDAQELYDVLGPIWGGSHLKLLLNAQATKAGIQSAITSWIDPLEDSDDTVLFFFSGHGAQASFDQSPTDESDGKDETICPYDLSPYSWSYDIFDDELNTWLSNLESSRQVVIINSCYSGGFIDQAAQVKLMSSPQSQSDDFAQDLTKSGRVILTGGEGDESTWETTALGHSVFPYYLLDGFEHLEILDSNSNNQISAEELFNYAQPRTVSYESANDYESIQHPQIYDGYAGELTLLTLATLTIDVDPRATSVTLDGVAHSASVLPVAVDFLPGTNHTFSVPSLVGASLQEPRYAFLSWDDGVTSDSRTVTVSESASYVANYKTQYYLTVQSGLGSPFGEGWYDEDASATFSVTTPVDQGEGKRSVFVSWTGDSADHSSSSSTVMYGPKTVTAAWQEYVQLTVSTVPSHATTASGSVWYERGETVTLEVPEVVYPEAGVRYVFAAWNVGGSRVNDRSISVKLDAPQLAEATYTTQYHLDVQSVRGSPQGGGWYNSGSKAAFSVESPVGTIVRQVFAGWDGDSSATTPDAPIIMNGAKTVIAKWRTDYTQLYVLIAAALVMAGLLTVLILLRRKRHSLRDLADHPSDRLDL